TGRAPSVIAPTFPTRAAKNPRSDPEDVGSWPLAFASGLERLDQLLFPIPGQAGLDDRRVERISVLANLVAQGRPGQQQPRRPALLELAADLFDGFVVDADV